MPPASFENALSTTNRAVPVTDPAEVDEVVQSFRANTAHAMFSSTTRSTTSPLRSKRSDTTPRRPLCGDNGSSMLCRPEQLRSFADAGKASDRRRILLCDAESQSLHGLRSVLRGAGFEVDVTRSAAVALDRCALRLPAAAIIELVLPDGDGVQVCRRLREWSGMPVIVLSAVRDEEEQVRALEAGADDYVTKPFRPRELIARLRANLRRSEPGGEEPCVELNGLEIDLAARTVRRDGDEIHLTPIEFRLLGVLAQNRGRLLTHNALLQQVWGAAYLDARQILRAHIANLRRKIEPAGRRQLIHTDHGVGYRLADMNPERAWRDRLAA